MKLGSEDKIISEEIRSIVENTNDMMFIKNAEFVYIAVSKSFAKECVGCEDPNQILGKTDFELFPDLDDAKRYRDADERLLSSESGMMEFEDTFTDPDANRIPCLVAKYRFSDGKGKPMAILGQYHAFEQSLTNTDRNAQDRKISIALTRSFFVSNYVDLKNRNYVNLWSMDYVKQMLTDCDTPEKGFEAFIQHLVRPEFVTQVRAFCNLDTLAERLDGKKQIDCEYLSKVATGWCRVSFYPAEWDEDGTLTHVLFTVAAVDEDQARIIEERWSSQKDLETIFNEVPGGIVMYRWDGKKLHILRMSQNYRDTYGYSETNEEGSPDFMKIHPEDVEDYKKAIAYALKETHTLEYVCRVWNRKRNRYGWTQINAVSKPQEDGSQFIYALYTDVTDRKLAELRLRKSKASMAAGLGAAEQFSYEYDPILHISTDFSDGNNGYHLGKVIENYPECFRDTDFMHPDDVEMFIETVHSIDRGENSAHCVIRANKNGKYHWHSCTFDAFDDYEKGYRVALLTVVDITSQVMVKQGYDEQIHALLSGQENIITMCTINLSTNTYEMVHTEADMNAYLKENASLDQTMMEILPDIVNEDSQNLYRKRFSREQLLKEAELGHMHQQQEFLLRKSDDHYEWVRTGVDMVRNPLTDEIGGVAYCKSAQEKHMESELLSLVSKRDYIFSKVVFRDTDEYYVYDSETNSFGERKNDFWRTAFISDPKCSPETVKIMVDLFKKEKMIAYLDEHEEFSYAFDSLSSGTSKRMEVRFRYLDQQKTMILVTLRDITDQSLQQKWKYESEHDPLTGLLNRKTVFEEARKTLTENPDKRYVLLHCDVRHFHLYNTFFGEEAGDQLLQRMANVLNEIGKEYASFSCARIESDVFCAFLPDEPELLEKHLGTCYQQLEDFSPDFPLELAIGAYWIVDPSMSIESMFSRATIAAKSGVKNLFGIASRYDEAMDLELKNTQQITSEMATAIDREQFAVYLQPKYSLTTNKIVGAEALVRWLHPTKGMISPAAFIPVFEKNGFIANLDRYMWEHVCRILSQWQKEGKPLLPISVNMSRVSVYSHATVTYLKSLVEEYELDPKYLELELTETAYIDDPEDLKRTLHELQAYGFRILMDDFGSGYSSLNTLRELPVDVLKLDMKFLAGLQNDARGNAVLSSVVRMSKLLRLPIVAEGVETERQEEYLRRIGVEYAQGYLFARPMPITAYENLMKEGNFESIEESETKTATNQIDGELNQYVFNAAEMVHAIENTGIRMFMYFPQTKSITVPEKTCAAYQCQPVYTNMPQSFADDYVHPNDWKTFNEMYYRIDRGEEIADAVFHSVDMKYRNHVTLTTVSWTADGKPKDVFGLIEDESNLLRSEEVLASLRRRLKYDGMDDEMGDILKNVAYAIGRQYYAVYHIRMEDHSFICLHENLEGILSQIGERGNYEKGWDIYINQYIEEQDREGLHDFININTLEERLRKQNSITHNYRRKEVGWTRGSFIAGKRDENGKLLTVIYTVADINSEVENELKRTEAEMEALKDPLTGLFNRKAFDLYKENDLYTKYPMGLMMVDVDRFKSINDHFGHEIGDQAIKEVADQIREVLRRDDLVFRVGGDEFIVLLHNCKKEIWNSLCHKLSQIHINLKETMPKDLTVTLSGGICLNESGYSDELIKVADQALYNTKANGRGGCTMVEKDGTIVHEWHDSGTVLRKGDVLERNSTVTWRVEIPTDDAKKKRLYGDDLLMSFIGASVHATPEEMYELWHSRVQPDYLEIIRQSLKAAITEGNSEMVYLWNHPEKGIVQLRCPVSLESTAKDYISVIGYAHITTAKHVYTVEDVSDRVRIALEEMYFCNFYIRLSDYSFRIYKAQDYARKLLESSHDAREAIALYLNYLADETENEGFDEFLDLSTIRERMKDHNILSINYHDANLGWMRARFVAVDRDENGTLESVSLVMEAI